VVTVHPWRNKLAWIAGISCRIFADAAFPFTKRHQLSPLIGPALTDGRNVMGINNSTACSRRFDSWIRPVSLANDEDFPAASCRVKADCKRRCIVGSYREQLACFNYRACFTALICWKILNQWFCMRHSFSWLVNTLTSFCSLKCSTQGTLKSRVSEQLNKLFVPAFGCGT